MSVWHVTNHKLYSGTSDADVSNPKFLVGTEFPFSKLGAGDGTNYVEVANWTGANQKANQTFF